jgi:hypothetical protein
VAILLAVDPVEGTADLVEVTGTAVHGGKMGSPVGSAIFFVLFF